ncbi:larval cuticle protein LCP-22-like [Melitaea cinxia]|uniref:larval cuticle protein LCP-22-like n=1 Tax=Melitaea cinxia TaxID=113334 RepID=UPI001E2706E8|nr:larval cuticle protein LCP-22-like [Melitaea cinxia]
MRFAVVVFACVLAAVSAQFNPGQYFPQKDQYQFNRYNQNNRFPYNNNNNYNNYNRYQNYNPYKPYVNNPRPTVTVAKATASVSPSVFPSFASVTPAAPAAVSVAPAVESIAKLPVAKAVSDDGHAETVKYGNEIHPDGSYDFYYETNNGIAAQSQGVPRNFGGSPPVAPSVAQGAFSWISPEGQLISIRYVADENGYQPSGDAIPQAPTIPPLIARSLEYIASHTPYSSVAVDKTN